MKKSLLQIALTLLLVLPAAPRLLAQAKHEHKEPDTELGKVMEKVNHSWRTIRKQVADTSKNASTLEEVAAVKTGLEKGLTLTPERAADVPAAEREKFVESYRSHLKEFITLVDQLTDALKANDNAGAAALVKKMGSAQHEDHKEFRRPDE